MWAGSATHAEVAIVDLSRQHGLRYWLLNGLILQGWVLAQEGAGEEGVGLMRGSAIERAGIGVGWYQVRYLCMLAETHLRLRPDGSRATGRRRGQGADGAERGPDVAGGGHPDRG